LVAAEDRERPGREVDIGDVTEYRNGTTQRLTQRDSEVAGIEHTGSDLGQEGAVEQVVSGSDEAQYRLIRSEKPLESAQGVEAGEASAYHHHLRGTALGAPPSLDQWNVHCGSSG
jgi:hypothetical protein